MGQTKSSFDSSPQLGLIQGKLEHHLEVIKRLAYISYKEFVDSVIELNKVSSSFTDCRGKQLHFQVKSGTDDTVLWKGTVRIQCQKVNVTTHLVESTRLLNLRQYIQVYKEITDQVSILPSTLSNGAASNIDICASIILDQFDNSGDYSDDECCICMEKKSEIILPCVHKFCEQCMDSWNVTSNKCPICRADVRSVDDTWVLTEKPDTDEYATEVKGYLVSIADRKGQSK
ncbi:hypothetical protein ACJMK2_019807 [Sinanodonta woodiana]|uniref:RING finger protein 141 n=1 Tax=Sinanodonta woodiana TaxID=1069815 RepID=A0ABD3TX38_SINWO